MVLSGYDNRYSKPRSLRTLNRSIPSEDFRAAFRLSIRETFWACISTGTATKRKKLTIRFTLALIGMRSGLCRQYTEKGISFLNIFYALPRAFSGFRFDVIQVVMKGFAE